MVNGELNELCPTFGPEKIILWSGTLSVLHNFCQININFKQVFKVLLTDQFQLATPDLRNSDSIIYNINFEI
jgi:hypothetical protein